MGLVRNLKKRFNNWVDITLAELCSAYIKQLAKQTTKKRNNSLVEESSLSLLVTEPPPITTATSLADISGRTILKDTDDIVASIRAWAIDRLSKADTIGEKYAIYNEFEEWIELADEDECDIVSVDFNILEDG